MNQKDFKILKTGEVAKTLGVTTATVRNFIKSKALPAIQISKHRQVVYQHDLDAFLSSRYSNAGGSNA